MKYFIVTGYNWNDKKVMYVSAKSKKDAIKKAAKFCYFPSYSTKLIPKKTFLLHAEAIQSGRKEEAEAGIYYY